MRRSRVTLLGAMLALEPCRIGESGAGTCRIGESGDDGDAGVHDLDVGEARGAAQPTDTLIPLSTPAPMAGARRFHRRDPVAFAIPLLSNSSSRPPAHRILLGARTPKRRRPRSLFSKARSSTT